MKNEFPNDYTLCEHEPIHIPGSIQSFAYLLLVDGQGYVQGFSENSMNLFPNLDLEQTISVNQLFPDLAEDILKLIASAAANRFFLSFMLQSQSHEEDLEHSLMVYDSDPGIYLLAIEPHTPIEKFSKLLMVNQLLDHHKVSSDFFNLIVRTLGECLNYDRVMIYKFYDDDHGEVISEYRKGDIESYLNQHFPAHDIPKQARELYLLNRLRIIQNRAALGSKIIHNAHLNWVDLSYTDLRSPSSTHLEYMKNMDVMSSMSISIVVAGRLWGLIACHGVRETYYSLSTRLFLTTISSILSTKIELHTHFEKENWRKQTRANISQFLAHYNMSQLKLTHVDLNTPMLKLIEHDAIVILEGDALSSSDKKISFDQFNQFISSRQPDLQSGLFVTNNLHALQSTLHGAHPFFGVMLIRISNEPKRYIAWLRRSFEKSILWAGKPYEKPKIEKSGIQDKIMPRKSFATWIEHVENQSKPWSDREIFISTQIKILLSTRF